MFKFLKSIFTRATALDLTEILSKKPFLVDVRTTVEYAQGHPKGSINIPLNNLPSCINKFKGKKDILVFCRSGNRSSKAKLFLESQGINNIIDAGAWKNVGKFTG